MCGPAKMKTVTIDICSGSQLAIAAERIELIIKIVANTLAVTRIRSPAFARGQAAIEMFSARCIDVAQIGNLRYLATLHRFGSDSSAE